MERRLAARDLTCPYVFHRNGRRIGDFRKLWTTACKAIGVTGRIVHDLRRSGVKHLIETPGNDPHTVMAFSGHSTPSMLRRYHIIDLDVMRQAAERASARRSDPGAVTPLRDRPTSALPR
jgi:integrase